MLRLLRDHHIRISIFLALLLLGVVTYFVFRNTDVLGLIRRLDAIGIILNLAIGIAFFSTNGIIMRLAYKHHYNCTLTTSDVFLLPITMHLFTYILPIKGGLIYQTFFVKAKYGLDLSKGFSVGVLVFAASLLITCFIGGALSFLVHDALVLQLVLLFMFSTLVFILFAGRFVKEPDPSKSGIINSVIAFIGNVLIQFREQLKDKKLLFKLIFVTLVSTIVHAAWFYHCAYALGYDPEPIGILLATLVLRIVTLVRILPGNLGIQEVMIGSVFLAAGLGLQEGLTTALLVRLVSVVLAGTLGIGGLYLNFRYFGTDTLSELLNKLKRSEN